MLERQMDATRSLDRALAEGLHRVVADGLDDDHHEDVHRPRVALLKERIVPIGLLLGLRAVACVEHFDALRARPVGVDRDVVEVRVEQSRSRTFASAIARPRTRPRAPRRETFRLKRVYCRGGKQPFEAPRRLSPLLVVGDWIG
jgi:hypothetical protein